MISLLCLTAALAQEPPAEPATEAEAPASIEVESASTEDGAAEATPTGPDRSAPPAVGPASPLELPEPTLHAINDGVSVYLMPLDGVRKVEIAITARRGTIDVDGWPTWSGRASGHLMDVATDERDADEIELLSAMHDLSVWSTGTDGHSQGLYLEVPRVDLDIGLDLLGDVLRHPAYPGKEARRYRKEQAFYWQAIAPTELGTIASSARSFGWFPEDHPYGVRRHLGELKDIKPKALAATAEAVWVAGPIDVVVVGDVSWEDVRGPLTEMFGDLGTAGDRVYAPPYDGPTDSRILAVDLPGEQAGVRLRLAGPRFDHADRDVASIVDFALGGHFLSRLNSNLREDKGLTYGSGSYLYSGRSAGTWDIAVDVKVENVGIAMTEIEREIGRLVADGVTAKEIEAAAGERIQTWNRTRLTAGTGMGLYESLVDDEETAAAARDKLAALADIDIADTQRVADAWLGEAAVRQWVIVGDRSQLEATLDATGLPVTWIHPADAVLGAF